MNVLESISSYNFVEIDGYAYFSDLFYNAFFSVEMKTGKAVFLGCFEDEKLSETNIHFLVMQKEKQIYFFPRFGCHMHIYNLSDKTMQMIEIRKESDPFLDVDGVVLNDNCIYFIAKEHGVFIKKLELETYKLTNINNEQEIRGKHLYRNRNIIPPNIIEKYKIKYGEVASCKQMSDGKWYCFKPTGRDILCFTEGTSNLEIIPLTVVNRESFEKHLIRVKQNLFQSRIIFKEFEGFKIKDLLEVVKLSNREKVNCCQEWDKYSTGKAIWKKTL